MSEQASPAQSNPQNKKGNRKLVVWTTRIVVFGVLLGLVAVAVYDFVLKNQCVNSQTNLNDNEDARKARTLTQKKVEEELLEGSPEIVNAKKMGETIVRIYKWNGPFRTYRIQARYAELDSSAILVDWTSKDEDIKE